MAESAIPEFSRVFETYHGKVLAYATKLGSWIYTITLNTVRDMARKRASRADRLPVTASSVVDGDEAGSPLARVPDTRSRSPEESAIRKEMVACYLDYVKHLAPPYHEVYVLSEFEHLTNDEIARRLCLSLATVKIRLHRARARLYDELRRNCRCYVNERGELMGEPSKPSAPD